MAVPERLLTLVERFERNRAAYRSGNYNEAQVRVDFINPMLELLGWDVDNRQGRPETYRDVIYEDRVKVGGGTKAPDYGFYAGGARKFFLEAKKPSVNLMDDVDPAVQLRRYAWSAKLPLSILTDFEEFAIYDCRFEPDKDDTPVTARLDFLTFEEYPDRWDDLYALFSREAVLEGSLEKYAERTRSKRGTQTVDSAFLREIERWRNALAQDLASRNNLNRRELNYAVQMTINRIVFLRMAEDRGVEDYGKLLALINGNGVYGRSARLWGCCSGASAGRERATSRLRSPKRRHSLPRRCATASRSRGLTSEAVSPATTYTGWRTAGSRSPPSKITSGNGCSESWV